MFRSAINFTKRSFSSSASELPLTYSTGVKAMHWGMGSAMLASVGFVLAAQNTTDKKNKGNYMFYHKSLGALSFLFLFPRLAIRLTNKHPASISPPNTPGMYLEKASHFILYSLSFMLPVTGVVMGMYSGFGLPFFFTTIPSIDKKPEISKPMFNIHKLAGQAIEYVVPIHVSGAFFHLYKGVPIFSRISGFGAAAAATTSIQK